MKKFKAIAICLALSFFLTGCGQSRNGAATTTGDSSPSTTDQQSPAGDTGSSGIGATPVTAGKSSISRNTWVSAYMDEMYDIARVHHSATLIYLNDDEIPEIVCFSGSNTAGSRIYSFQMDALGGRVVYKDLHTGDFLYYKEKGGYLSYNSSDGRYNYDEMFLLKNGKFETLFSGAIFLSTSLYAISGTASNKSEYYSEMEKVARQYTDLRYCNSGDYKSNDELRTALDSFPDNLACEYLTDKDGYVAQQELSFNNSTDIDNYWAGSDTFDLEGYFKALGGKFFPVKDNGKIIYYMGTLGDWTITIIAKEYFDSSIVQVRFNGASKSYMLNRTKFKNDYKLADTTAIKVKGYDATINKESINFLPIVVKCVINCTGEDPYEGVYPELLFATDNDEFYYQAV